MKLPIYIQSKQINGMTPQVADSTIISIEDFDNKDINIELLIVVLMLSQVSMQELVEAAKATEYSTVAFYHRGKCIDAFFYDVASDEHEFSYPVSSIIQLFGSVTL